MSAPAPAWRFAFFYSGAFLALGVVIPFWPLWLESRGLDLVEIGQLLALATWCKMISTPMIGQISDRSGRGKTVLVLLSAVSLLCYLAFLPATGFWLLLAIQLSASMAFQALIPLGESRTMQVVLRDGLDYGRVRLWGSFTFMMGTLACGLLVRSAGPNWVLYLAIAALFATLIASALLPSGERARPGGRLLSGFRQLLRLPGFLVFLLVAGLLQGSHALYYGFSTLHWQSAGISPTTIGLLWAGGVLAEILLFAVAGKVLGRMRPVQLLMIAGVSGLVRWGVLGTTTALPLLALAQVFHAGTFGAAHLATVHFIARTAVPHGLGATAQSLYAAFAGGLVMGLLLLISGPLYAAFGGQAFYAMAGLSAIALFLCWPLARLSPSGGLTR